MTTSTVDAQRPRATANTASAVPPRICTYRHQAGVPSVAPNRWRVEAGSTGMVNSVRCRVAGNAMTKGAHAAATTATQINAATGHFRGVAMRYENQRHERYRPRFE